MFLSKTVINLSSQRLYLRPLLCLSTVALLSATGATEITAAENSLEQIKLRTTVSKESTGKSPSKTPSKSNGTAGVKTISEPVYENIQVVTPEELVSKPQEYLNENVKFTANFYAFSSLALDYKPAYRSSKTHLSLLVLRPNSHVPLSELKLAMMVPKEKDPETALLATLKDGDQIEVSGKVFSIALDDPWIEIFKLKKLSSKKEDKDKVIASEEQGNDNKDKKLEENTAPDKKPTTQPDKSLEPEHIKPKSLEHLKHFKPRSHPADILPPYHRPPEIKGLPSPAPQVETKGKLIKKGVPAKSTSVKTAPAKKSK